MATVAFAAFLVWFYRAYKNLTAFETMGLRDKPGWAIGWFFIPVFCLFRPYLAAQALWKASDPAVDSRDAAAWQQAPAGRAVDAWWGMTLLTEIYIIVFVIFVLAFKPSGSIVQLLTAGYELVSVATNLLIVCLIRSVTARQRAKAEALFAMSQQMI